MEVRRLLDATTPASRPTATTALPFVLLGFGAMAALLLPPYPARPLHLLVAAGLCSGLFLVHRAALARTERTWLDVAAPLGAFPLVLVLRDATGGAASGLSPLVALPIFWLALYGTRRDLVAASLLVVLTFLAPVLVVGGPDYPVGEWRRALMWGAVSMLIAPVVQHVVRQLAVETRHRQDNAARVEASMRAATLSSLITTDTAGRVRTFSAGAERELGHRERDVVGHDFTSFLLVPRELREVADELGVEKGFAVLARLAHRRAQSRIWTLVRADGQPAYMRMAVTELRDEAARLAGYLCVAIDATAAIRSQRALTQAEERWRILMDHLPDTTVVMVEERTGITVVTGAGALATRLRYGAGPRLTEIVDHGAPGRMERILAQAFAGHEADPVHALVGDLEHEIVVSPLRSVTDKRQALVMARDVSQERQRERSPTAAEELAERLFDDAPQGVALLDLQGGVVQANPALQALLGGEDLVGRSLALRSFADGDSLVERHLQSVRTSEDGRAESPWSVRGASGEELHVVLISSLLGAVDRETGTPETVLTHVIDVSESHRYERRLAFLAEHDSLTGLANRRRFDQQLERHVEECRRYGARGAVLMLDLDRFKEVNDTLGHAVGDQLLRDVGRVLTQRMRSTDLVARLGGDEFAVLMPHADRTSAELVAADLVACIRAEVLVHSDTRRNVSLSLGGATVEPVHASASELLSAADAAMYLAKSSGRDRYAFLAVPDGS